MKISEFSNHVEEIIPAGFQYRAQGRTAYNANNVIEPVFLFVPPRTWALNWRPECSHDETVRFMIGLPTDLKKEGLEQWADLSPITARNALIDAAESFMKDLHENAQIQIIDSGIHRAEFYDSPEGFMANNLVWIDWSVEVRLYDNITYVVDKAGNFITDSTGNKLTV